MTEGHVANVQRIQANERCDTHVRV
jgi:hypothetical protein